MTSFGEDFAALQTAYCDVNAISVVTVEKPVDILDVVVA